MRIVIKEDFCEDLILEVYQETDFYYLCYDEEGYVYRVRKNECKVIEDRYPVMRWWHYAIAVIGFLVLIYILYDVMT